MSGRQNPLWRAAGNEPESARGHGKAMVEGNNRKQNIMTCMYENARMKFIALCDNLKIYLKNVLSK